jgi:hypothetical protein
MKTASVEVRIADMPAFRSFLGAVATLMRALGECENLPEPVMAAADQLRQELAALGGRDIGPPP